MSILLVDAGNSRLKWAVLRAGTGVRLARRGAADWTASNVAAALRRMLRAAGMVEAMYVCNVAGHPVERALRAAARARGIRRIHVVRSATGAHGVRNGYRDAWRLGADRWVALIGARKAHPGRALCIVNIGTAMTIDLIDAAGRHRGGSITPGPTMMQAALLTNTAGIRRRARGARPGKLTLFASNTRAALSGGATFACAALIERAGDEARTLLGSRPILILDGGAAAMVAPLLRLRALRQDDLVLRGLAAFAAAAKDIA